MLLIATCDKDLYYENRERRNQLLRESEKERLLKELRKSKRESREDSSQEEDWSRRRWSLRLRHSS